MTEAHAFDPRTFIEFALQAAEADALQQGCVPGWDMMADYVMNAFRERGVAVIALPELPSEDRQRGYQLPGTDISVKYRDYGDEGDEFQLWVNSPTRPSRIQKVYDASAGRDLAALILAAEAAYAASRSDPTNPGFGAHAASGGSERGTQQ